MFRMSRTNPSSKSPPYSVQTYTTHPFKSTSQAVTESLQWVSETVSEALNWRDTEARTGETEAGTGASISTEATTSYFYWGMKEATAGKWESTTDGTSYSPVKALWSTVEEITKLLKTASPDNIETKRNSHVTIATENPGTVSSLESRSTTLPQITFTESAVTTVEKDGSSMWTSETIVAMGWMSSAAVLVLLLAILICIYMWKFVWTKSRSAQMKNKKTLSNADKGGDVKLVEMRSRKQTGIVRENRTTKMG